MPDEDWDRMDVARLQAAMGRMVKMLSFLIKENRELTERMKGVESKKKFLRPPPGLGFDQNVHKGVEELSKPWKADENMEVVVLSEMTGDEIKGMDEARLRHGIAVGRATREELLNRNEALIEKLKEMADGVERPTRG